MSWNTVLIIISILRKKAVIPDLINGSFEFLAGFFVLGHCFRLYRDKKVRGVSITAFIFFTLWGYWNLFYYPHLNQWWSFFGGLSIVTVNTIYDVMLIYYILKERRENAIRN